MSRSGLMVFALGAGMGLIAWSISRTVAQTAPSEAPGRMISPDDWTLSGPTATAQDDVLGRPTLTVAAGKTLSAISRKRPGPAYVAEAVVRFPASTASASEARAARAPRGRGASATLTLGDPGEDSACSVALGGISDRSYVATITRGSSATAASRPVRPVRAAKAAKAAKAATNAATNAKAGPADNNRPEAFHIAPRFPLDKISPTWEEQFRTGIENDMTSLPLASERWLRLAIEVRPQTVRLYQNQMLLAEIPNAQSEDAPVHFALAGDARLASLSVRPLEAGADRYQPVRLDDLYNSPGSPAGGPIFGAVDARPVGSVPFVFPGWGKDDTDHQDRYVDIGKSLFRYRLAVGSSPENASPSRTWPAPAALDPDRLRLRVPNRAYQRVWLVAGAEENPNKSPVLTVRFYKPGAGWPVDAAARVTEGKRVEITKPDGKSASLWLIGIDVDAAALASEFRGQDAIDVELTKQVMDFRAFPDPASVGSYQGGLPSSVQLHAMTLEAAPVSFIASSEGKDVCAVYENPDKPQWAVQLKNQSAAEQPVKVSVEVSDPYGQKTTDLREANLAAGKDEKIVFEPKVNQFGLYSVKTTVACGSSTQSRTNTFLLLPPDARKADAKTTRWGIWDWNGGHKTNPDTAANLRLLNMLGARMGSHLPYEQRKGTGVGAASERIKAPTGNLEDPAVYKQAVEEISKEVEKFAKDIPDLEYISPFAEWSLSNRLTHGVPPQPMGLPKYEYTDKEKANYQRHLLIVKALSEATRKTAPNLKVLFGVCGGIYTVPFMENGYPKDLVDGYGLDLPQFMRMPERQPRAVEPSQLYYVKEAMKKYGYEDKQLVHFESYFPSSLPLTGGVRNSADLVVRTAVLAMALGTDRFGRCWELYDSADYWGTQQYGCAGLMGRYPEYNPKPAAAAFATMTQMIDTAKYDGFVPTGSLSSFCVRFKDSDKLVYCLWTLRGQRPLSLSVAQGASMVLVDENGNQSPVSIQGGKAQVMLTPTPAWLVVKNGEIAAAESGAASFADAPGKYQKPLAFDKGDWKPSAEPNELFATNSWDRVRRAGPMTFQLVDTYDRKGNVVQATLGDVSDSAPLIGWYGQYVPAQPIAIPGKAKALGLWVKGNSGWGRIVYEITDANGEVFQSVGTKDSWNCDDTHSWSYINFDGWRYLSFPLPGNAPGDDYREADSIWWNHNGDGIVQLPIKLTKIIVEMPSQVLYVDQFQPVKDRTIQFDDLMAVYDDEASMTDAPVKLQQAANGIIKPTAGLTGQAGQAGQAGRAALPNPIAELEKNGAAAPTAILEIQPPAERSDGTQAIVSIKPVEGALEYQVWVSAYDDGRGARVLYAGTDSKGLVKGLRPDFALYFFATYTLDGKQQSKPSAARRIVIKDEFPFK